VAAGVAAVMYTDELYAAHVAECPNRPGSILLALSELERRAERLEMFSQALEQRFIALDHNLIELGERLDVIAGDVASLALKLITPPEGNA
jgi:hypothetical protein